MKRAKFGEDVVETTSKNSDDFLRLPGSQYKTNTSAVEGYTLDHPTMQTTRGRGGEHDTPVLSKDIVSGGDHTDVTSFLETSEKVIDSETSVTLGDQTMGHDVTDTLPFHFNSSEAGETQADHSRNIGITNDQGITGLSTTSEKDRIMSTSKFIDTFSTSRLSTSHTTEQTVLQPETTYADTVRTTKVEISVADHISNQTTLASDVYSNFTEQFPLGHHFNWSVIPIGPYNTNSTFLYQNITNASSFNSNLVPYLTLASSTPVSPDVAATGMDTVTWDVVVKIIVLALISLVGSFGNIMVIWSIVKERHLHRPPFYFLLSLGVTDLSRAVFCVPVVITTVFNGSTWKHGESACKLFAFATSFFVFSSALSLLAIAIDRHVSIVYSKTYRRRSLGIANLVVAIVIWVIAFSVSFPPVVGVGDYVFIPDEAQCAYQHKHYTNNDSVASVLVFLAILFLTYFLYFRIFRYLRAHRRMRPLQHTPARSANWAFVGPGANGQAFINWLNGFGGQAPIRQGGQRSVQRLNFGRVVNLSTAKNEHLTRLFLVLTMIFGITWSPYVVLSLWRIFCDASILPSSYVTAAAWLGYGQVAVCPIVYLVARGPARNPTRTVYSHAEKREFLLENKIAK